MKVSLNRLRYYLGWKDAVRVAWQGYRNGFTKLHIGAYKHPVYLRSFEEDYGGFDYLLVAKDYKFRMPHTPKTILDGGGNIGLASIYFANRYPGAEILSIEPDSRNFAQLKKNTEAYPQVEVLQGGLWGYPAYLKVVDKGLGPTSLEVVETSAEEAGAIRGYSIAELMAHKKWETIDLLKLDVEGAEKHLAEHGADVWLPKTKFIAVECHDRRRKDSSKAFFKALEPYNFSMEPLRECLLFYNEDLIEMFDPYHENPAS